MKEKIITIIFISYIFIFSIYGIILKDKEISNTERRKLQTFPEFELKNTYINKLDKYFLDHFPNREEFRSIKAKFNINILRKLDNNKIYIEDKSIYKSNYPTNKDSINYFIKHINTIKSMLNSNNKVYILGVPDKNYYLESKDFLQIDYNYIYNNINKLGNFIDVRDILNKDDYYYTDTHWRQENLDKVVKKMSEVMNFNYQNIKYNKNYYDKFYGVYYGESAIKGKGERLTYLTNNILDNVSVKYLENNKLNTVYNPSKLNSMDSYNVFLDGASSFIEITNNNSIEERELVIFRDSFGSSLTPLLIPYYSKITVIDNRYINSKYFNNLIEFKDQDVLFLYSTLVINNSTTLKN